MQLKTPDRVPVVFWDVPLLACRYAGLPYSAAYYDAPAWRAAFKKMFADLEPDGPGNEEGWRCSRAMGARDGTRG
jgi:hypothetical protein